MKLSDLIDFCTVHTDITLWIKEFNGLYYCTFKCTFKCGNFYGFKSYKFYDDTYKEENAIFIDVVDLKQYNVCSIYPSGLNELEVIIE